MTIRFRNGYTLLEFLIYIAIVGVLVIATTSVMFAILGGQAKLQAIQEVGYNSRAAMERMLLAIRNANAITTPGVGSTSSILILQMPNSSASPTQFLLANGALQMKEGSSATSPLTGDEIVIRNLTFRNLTATGTQGTIRIEMSVSSSNPGGSKEYDANQSFNATASIRKRP
jgi:type II secretory pathway pseudopilin PulG